MQIIVKLVLSAIVFGVAFFFLKTIWRNEVDWKKFLSAPSEAIPVKPPIPQANVEYGFVSLPLDYEPGVQVGRVIWQKGLRRALFVLKNTSRDVPLLDGVLSFELPVAVVDVQIDNQQSCQDLIVSQLYQEVGVLQGSGKLVPATSFRNDFTISFSKIAPGGIFTVSATYADDGIHATGALDLVYSPSGSASTSERKLIVAEGSVPRAIRVDHGALPPEESRIGISFGSPVRPAK